MARNNDWNRWAACIGGAADLPCGNIVIEGGTITASGGAYSAGIGGGSGGNCGTITITGGKVTANKMRRDNYRRQKKRQHRKKPIHLPGGVESSCNSKFLRRD